MRNQWAGLRRYLSDSRIPIDNSASEQDVRPLTVGRSNWKFLGHPQAAAGRLQVVSIVSSAVRHHLMVHDYLEDVLRKLADAAQHHPAQLELGSEYLLDLLPDRWVAAHPQSVRHERIAEQQQIAENKRARRARQRILERRRNAAQRRHHTLIRSLRHDPVLTPAPSAAATPTGHMHLLGAYEQMTYTSTDVVI